MVNGSEGQIWSVIIIDNTLFSAGDNGIMVISPAGTYKINVPGAWRVSSLAADRDKLIVSTYSGFSIMKKENGRWVYSHKAPDFIDSCRGFIEDEENYELQHENLKNELRYKTQEISGYILNLIRKNEMLEDVKKNALSISKAIDEEKQLPIIRQKVMRLISQINSNVEHDGDFEVFQSNFDLIHKDFFKLLDGKFPGLTRNDKILCAYLNMNLSSKGIAPLLNISVRGVEVNRYRLRKKMNLDRDVGLSEFLRNLK